MYLKLLGYVSSRGPGNFYPSLGEKRTGRQHENNVEEGVEWVCGHVSQAAVRINIKVTKGSCRNQKNLGITKPVNKRVGLGISMKKSTNLTDTTESKKNNNNLQTLLYKDPGLWKTTSRGAHNLFFQEKKWG